MHSIDAILFVPKNWIKNFPNANSANTIVIYDFAIPVCTEYLFSALFAHPKDEKSKRLSEIVCVEQWIEPNQIDTQFDCKGHTTKTQF